MSTIPERLRDIEAWLGLERRQPVNPILCAWRETDKDRTDYTVDQERSEMQRRARALAEGYPFEVLARLEPAVLQRLYNTLQAAHAETVTLAAQSPWRHEDNDNDTL